MRATECATTNGGRATAGRAVALVALVASGPVAAGAAPAAAEPSGTSRAAAEVEHCVVHVLGQEPNGRFVTDEPTCYPTLAEALADAAGGPVARPGEVVRAADLDQVVSAASINLAVHYDGAGLTGSSITVSGGDCNGGYVNLTSGWTNRISSSFNGCRYVNYFDGFDKSGTNELTDGVGAHNLGALNNASNSIGYA